MFSIAHKSFFFILWLYHHVYAAVVAWIIFLVFANTKHLKCFKMSFDKFIVVFSSFNWNNNKYFIYFQLSYIRISLDYSCLEILQNCCPKTHYFLFFWVTFVIIFWRYFLNLQQSFPFRFIYLENFFAQYAISSLNFLEFSKDFCFIFHNIFPNFFLC